MRLTIAMAIAGSVCFGQVAALAQDRLPAAGPSLPRSSQIFSMVPTEIGIAGDRLVFASAGAVFALIAMNFVSGGAIVGIFGVGGSNAPVASLAFLALREVAWHGTVWGAGPAAVLNVGQPVDAALRDGYTTPSTLAAAFEESGRRAESLVVKAGTYFGDTVGAWWDRL